MKNTIKLSMKLSGLALAAVLTACGGGGGGAAPASTAVLAPGIWKKADNLTADTKFIGVVTTAGSGGDVWALTYDKNLSTVKLFTGSVSASGDSFVTNQGTEATFSSTGGFLPLATGKSLTLPKSASTAQQVFDFWGASFATGLDSEWSTTAQLNSRTDWNDTWNSKEDPLVVDENIRVSYVWNVSPTGLIEGSKTVQGQDACTIKPGSAVTAREKAVVNVNVTYVCNGVETAFSGISFPLEITPQGVVNYRAVVMKQLGISSNKYVTQVFGRRPS